MFLIASRQNANEMIDIQTLVTCIIHMLVKENNILVYLTALQIFSKRFHPCF